jgi:hypothetical protein
MEGASNLGDTQNRCRLASCWIPAVFEMAFQRPVEGRSNAREPRDSSFDFSNGCRKFNLGERPAFMASYSGWVSIYHVWKKGEPFDAEYLKPQPA